MKKRTKKILLGVSIVVIILALLFLMLVARSFPPTTKNNVVDQYYQTIQSYYSENRKYPSYNELSSFQEATDEGFLAHYPNSVRKNDLKEYENKRFYYFVDDQANPQAFILCASYSDDKEIASQTLGGYCNGNGFGIDLGFTNGTTIDKKLIPAEESSPGSEDDFYNLIDLNMEQGISGVWRGSEWEE